MHLLQVQLKDWGTKITQQDRRQCVRYFYWGPKEQSPLTQMGRTERDKLPNTIGTNFL